MNISSFSAQGFRNLSDTYIKPCTGINVIYGNNGHGKTNLLEAIGLFSGMRSFRGARNSQMIREDFRGTEKDFSRLRLEFFAQRREQEAELTITPQSRDLILNGVRKEAASAMIGSFCTVVFSPDRMSLITGGASERRRFIDAAIGQFFPNYTAILYKFNQILQQRNTLLKDIQVNSQLLTTLDIWDESLASYGAAVTARRQEFAAMLSPAAARLYEGISSGTEPMRVNYESAVFGAAFGTGENAGIPSDPKQKQNALKEAYCSQLAEGRQTDLRLGYTYHGPQRDDLELLVKGTDVRIYGSQGQKRSVVLSLKLAEAQILAELIGELPVALLDDVMSELDSTRQDFLLNRLSNWQVFITCCDPAPLNLLGAGKIFHVVSGCVSEA